MKKLLNTLYDNKHILLIVVFSLISAVCLFMKGDDYIWYYVMEEPKLESYRVPNGRYFSNALTYILLRNTWLKRIFYTVILSLMILITGRFTDFSNKKSEKGIIFSFFMFFMIPSDTFTEVVNWFSGFTNYAFSFLLTSIYILFCFRIAFGEYKPKNWLAPVLLVFAFISGLCVEHISIYNILFSVFAVVLIKYKKKKVYMANIFYTVGAVAGMIVMMMNNTYSKIINSGDEIGVRGFEFSFSDIYMNLFRYLQPHYASSFWAVNLIITISLLIIYSNSVIHGNNYKYGKISMFICIGFTAYSIVVSCFSSIESFSGSMKIRGIETAFTFTYLVSITYLVVKLIDKDKAIRCITYLVSTLITSLPFLIVSPITARCMFVNYMFWIILGGELFFCAVEYLPFISTAILKDVLFVSALIPCIIISGFDICNYYYDNIRYDYMKQQISEGKNNISVISIPYISYSNDDINVNEITETDDIYKQYIFRYHDVECLCDEKYTFSSVSPNDYNTLMESD